MGANVQEFPPGAVQRCEERRGAASHWDTVDLSVDTVDRVYVCVVNDSIKKLDKNSTTVVDGQIVSFPRA
jgi:hypothetical protein